VSAEAKLELPGLIDGAVRDGSAHTRTCRVLDLADVRAHRWRQRLRETGSLEDGRPVGDAIHRLPSREEQAIHDLIGRRGWVDRSHRKLAHRGSYAGTVFVSPSTLLRVALKHPVELPGEPVHPRPKMPTFPEVPWERNRISIWDCAHRLPSHPALSLQARPNSPAPFALDRAAPSLSGPHLSGAPVMTAGRQARRHGDRGVGRSVGGVRPHVRQVVLADEAAADLSLAPVDEATRLPMLAIAAGAVPLGTSYMLGMVNRRPLRRVSSRTAQERQRSTQPLP
jgi:hypothetical protein